MSELISVELLNPNERFKSQKNHTSDRKTRCKLEQSVRNRNMHNTFLPEIKCISDLIKFHSIKITYDVRTSREILFILGRAPIRRGGETHVDRIVIRNK